MDKIITTVGLALTLVGAVMLFRLGGVPYKKVSGGVLFGPLYLPTEDAAAWKWQTEAGLETEQWSRLAKWGFGLIAAGTLLQGAAVWCAP